MLAIHVPTECNKLSFNPSVCHQILDTKKYDIHVNYANNRFRHLSLRNINISLLIQKHPAII